MFNKDDQVRSKIGHHIWGRAWHQVTFKLCAIIYDQVWWQFRSQVRNKIDSTLWDQLYEQIREDIRNVQ